NADKYIGLDPELKESERIIYTEGNLQISESIMLLSPEGREKKYDSLSSGLNMKKNGQLVPDDFRHEQYMLIKENGRNILFSGCSHNGILNIAEWFKPDVLIGGFHFFKADMDDRLAEYAKIMNNSGTDFYTCHCTGTDRYEFMKPYMKKLAYLSAGETIEL
ncbi:MAG: MBL fold metallo-hydrolase, partial [Clostridia bacterium]|nr:MBL fold metallo-hydrolase [Clostridia bacterium]